MASSSWKKIEKLGQGSYGRVDLATNGWCFAAVKSSMVETSSSFETELGFLKQLSGNPYVVECYGKDISQEEDGSTRFNILMEFAPFGTLHDLINQHLDESTVAYYTYQLLGGLSSIHRRGIVHCDVKPKNILVFESRPGLKQLKLADFGCACYDESESFQFFRGTPMYGSPEAVDEGLHGKGTDIWSLGMTVLEMLYRGKPMRDESFSDTVLMSLTAQEGPPEIPENVSESCRDFLIRCLEMEFEDRPSADELLKHDFIRRNVKKPWLGIECVKMSPFGSWSETEGLFSDDTVPEYQLFLDCGNAHVFGDPHLNWELVAV